MPDKSQQISRVTDVHTFIISEGQTMSVEPLSHAKPHKTPIPNPFRSQASLRAAQLIPTEEVQLQNMLLRLSFNTFPLFFCSHACQSMERGSMQCIFSSTG